jgi:hypothetical protein
MFFDLSYFLYIFQVKFQLFVTLKSDQDRDPDPHRDKKLDPDAHLNQCGSTILLRSKLGGQTSILS